MLHFLESIRMANLCAMMVAAFWLLNFVAIWYGTSFAGSLKPEGGNP